MAAFNFPNSPSTNDLHTENNVTWKWNGTVWKRINNSYLTASTLNVSGIGTFGGVLKIPTVAGTNTNAALNVLFQTATGVIDGGSNLTYNPGGDVLSVNGNHISINTFRGNGDLGTLTCDNHSSTTFVKVSSKVDLGLKDNTAGAFNVKEGSNEYITVDTTNSSELIKFGTAGSERLRITSGGNILAGRNSDYWSSRAAFQEDKQGRTAILVKNDTNHADASSSIILNAYGNSWTINCGSTARDSNAFTINQDATSNSNQGTERFRITSAGRVLIGTTDEGHGNADDLTVATAGGSLGHTGITIRSGTSSDGNIFFSDATSGDGETKGVIKYAHNGDYLRFDAGGAERLRIASDGKMGIGVASPAVKAHISDEYTAPTGGFDSNVVLAVTKNAGASSYAGIAINSGASGGSFIHFGDTGDSNIGRILYESDNSMRFTTNNSEQLRIDSNGRLKINHTNTSGQLDDTFLSIYDANSQSGISRNYAMINLHNYGSGSPGDTAGIGFGAGSSFAYTKGSIGFERTDGYGRGALVFCTNNDADTTLVNNTDERMRITQAGDVAIGKDTAQANYVAGSTTTRLAVVKDSAGSGYHEIANFTAGSDSNDTGAIVRIGHYSNDRGIYIKAGRGTSDQAKAIFGLRNSSAVDQDVVSVIQGGLVEIPGDVMVSGSIYGGNGARRNWFDNGAMNVIQRYQNCHVVGNYHSYGWAIDRFQNRGGNSQWQRSTNVPSGKGFDYALKVGSGTGGSVCQGIELTHQGKAGPFAVGTFWCVSFWSTQPVNTGSNNGFCQDLSSANYVALSLRTPSSGNAYAETGETASGTASGTYKRYYAIFEVTSGPHANNHTLNFGWAFNYSGSGTSEWTGFQCEQVANASCKPSDYEHVDYATDLKRCQRYCWRSTAARYVNGYKRHDSQINFGIQCPVPMTPKTVSNGGGTIGVVSWDYGTLTDFGSVWQNPAATAIGLYEMDYDSGWCVINLTTAYTGCSHCLIPSWESAQFEVACGPF